jgi:hypothetical protein
MLTRLACEAISFCPARIVTARLNVLVAGLAERDTLRDICTQDFAVVVLVARRCQKRAQ